MIEARTMVMAGPALRVIGLLVSIGALGCAGGKTAEKASSTMAVKVPDARPEARRAFEEGIRLLGLGPAHDEQARSELERAVGMDPNLFEAWHNLGFLDARRGRWAEAADHYQRALKVQPGSRASMQGLAQAWHHAGRHEPAQKLYRKWAEAHPDDWELRLAYVASLRDGGKPRVALDEVLKILARDSNNAEAFNALGLVYRVQKRLSLAETAFRRAVELDNRSAHVWNNLGLLALDRGDNQAAFTHFQKATELDPRYVEALINQAVVFMDCGAYDLASGALEKALHVDERDPDIQVAMGVAARGAGQFDKAVRHYEKALQLRPDYPPALYNLGILFMEHQDQPQRARASFLLFSKVAGTDDPKRNDVQLRLKMLKGTGS